MGTPQDYDPKEIVYRIGTFFLLIGLGGSVVKPCISGTVQKTCTESQRPLGFSIYYMLVNVGGFIGPNLSGRISEPDALDDSL